MIPYMRRNLARKRRALAAADAIVAVSSTIAADLRERAPEAAGTRLEVIPNPVNTAALQALGASRPAPRAGAYALYVGKLEPNKGAGKLIPAMAGAPADLPLVIVGDGALREQVERQAADAGRAVQITGWIDRDDVAAWMAHAAFVVFPSHGPESLSRVLLEAGALGVAAAAMDTGGTRDIIADEVTGLLSRNVPELTEDVARLAADAALRRRLGEAARRHVEATFDAGGVVDRIEALYVDLLDRRAAGRDGMTHGALRVAVLTRAVFPLHGYGGLERHVYDLVRHLDRRGVSVILITRPPTHAVADGHAIGVPLPGPGGGHGPVQPGNGGWRGPARAG